MLAIFAPLAAPQALLAETDPNAMAQPGSGPKALANCQVQTVSVAAPQAAMIETALLSTTVTDDPLQDYHPHALVAGGDKSAMRLVVHGLTRHWVVDLQISFDGVGYREVRDKWIDEVLKQSSPPEASQASSGSTDSVDNEAKDEAGGEKEETAATVGVRPRYRQAPTIRSRLEAYLKAVGAGVPREDIHFLLDRWAAGSAVTVLSPGRSWQRFGIEPLVSLLDQDSDGSLSTAEVAAAEERLKRADINDDGVVTFDELKRRTAGKTGKKQAPRSPLTEIVESPGEVAADLTLQVEFNRGTSGPGKVSLVSAGSNSPGISGSEDTIAIDFRPEYFEVSALQTAGDSKGPGDQPEQLAIGAVVDGYPLWRQMDLNGDQRLTRSEQRSLLGLLRQIDLNNDGAVSEKEIPQAIRLAIGRGPIIHQTLSSQSTAIGAKKSADVPAVAAPDWFLAMDLNGDGELSRDEFVGGKEQFAGLDSNGDGLIGAAEAAGEQD